MVDNQELLTKVLQLLSQYLTGANPYGMPNTAFMPNMSYAHSVGQYTQSKERSRFTDPITSTVYGQAGEQLYINSLRLLGYTQEKAKDLANSEAEGVRFLKWGSSLGMEMYMGASASRFANAAYQRAIYATPQQNLREIQDSYKAASKAIFEGVADGSIRGYTVPEALTVSSTFIRQGRYDNDDNNTRVARIKRDLQDYAKGISNLRDGLQGSIEQVLDSFEKLTGSSATVMHKDRFTSLTRSIYNATVFGGVTPQLLQNSIATQNAYLQGFGATQATATALGTVNANVLAQGATVEGATLNTMSEGLNRLGAQWVSTGRLKELTAAYGWWADTKGKQRNSETFQTFLQEQLNGDLSANNIRAWLEKENVSGEYINSARNRRNMAASYIHTAFLKERENLYSKSFSSLVNSSDGMLSERDKFLSDDELFDRLKQAYIDKNVSVEDATIRANQLVTQRRRMYSDIMYMTDADTGFNLLKNIGLMERQQRRQKSTDILANMLGTDKSVTGFAGALGTFMKNHKADKVTVADILKGVLGINVDDATINNIMDTTDPKKLEDMLTEAGVKDTDIKFAVDNLTKISDAERNIIFNSASDERKLKDGTTYGDLRRSIASDIKRIRTSGKKPDNEELKKLRSNLDKAVSEGFITKQEAFTIASSGDIDFRSTPKAYEIIDKAYKATEYAEKKLGITDRAKAEEFGNNIKHISVLDKDSKEYKVAYDRAVNTILENDKDVKNLKVKDGENLAEKQKELAVSKLESMIESPTDIVGFLSQILNELQKLVVKQ